MNQSSSAIPSRQPPACHKEQARAVISSCEGWALVGVSGVSEAGASCVACAVPPRTLYRWLKDPQFSEQYRRAKRDAFGQAGARLQQGTGAAAAVMLKLMVDAGVPASTRLRAADCVFTHAKNAIELEEIEARVTALEQAAELSKNDR